MRPRDVKQLSDMKLEYMSDEESAFEDESDEESGNQRLEKLVIRKFEWRSEELEREFRSLDRKANRAGSERGTENDGGKGNGELSSWKPAFFSKGCTFLGFS